MIKNLFLALSAFTHFSVFGIKAEKSGNLTGLPEPGCFPGEVCDDC